MKIAISDGCPGWKLALCFMKNAEGHCGQLMRYITVEDLQVKSTSDYFCKTVRPWIAPLPSFSLSLFPLLAHTHSYTGRVLQTNLSDAMLHSPDALFVTYNPTPQMPLPYDNPNFPHEQPVIWWQHIYEVLKIGRNARRLKIIMAVDISSLKQTRQRRNGLLLFTVTTVIMPAMFCGGYWRKTFKDSFSNPDHRLGALLIPYVLFLHMQFSYAKTLSCSLEGMCHFTYEAF